MDKTVNQSLQKIAKGAGLIFIGTIIGMLFGFLSRVIIIRYISQEEYGIFALCLVAFNIVASISILGLGTGVPRQIGFYTGKGDKPTVRKIALGSIQIGLTASIILSLIIILTSDLIAKKIYDIPEFADPLKIIAIGIPFFAFMRIIISIFQGLNYTRPQIYFDNILRNIAFIILVFITALVGGSYLGIIYSFTASVIISAVACLIYYLRISPVPHITENMSAKTGVRKELVLFSLPLLAVTMFNQIITWLDTLLLGYFMEAEDVGLYNAAVPLVHLLLIALTAIRFLYVPMMSELYAKNEVARIKGTYSTLTKWSFSVTLPLFLIFILFPEATLTTLFGAKYVDASSSLQILSLGFFISVVFGPNGPTLTSLGKTRILLTSIIAAVILNIILNIVLIPPLGIKGAAIATAAALSLRNIIVSGRLYHAQRIHPLTTSYLRPVLISGSLIAIIYFIVTNMINPVPLWLLPILLFSFLGIYGFSILLTRSFNNEDLMMMLALEKKLGLNLHAIKGVLKRFM